MFNSSTKEIIIDAANEHYDVLYESIKNLVETERELDLTLTIKFKGVSVDLNVSESLIVINTLAVKRAELRGGLWSIAGKRVESPLWKHFVKFILSMKNITKQNLKETQLKVLIEKLIFIY
ncbi:hypothetical protein TRIP_D300068 [uncultured Paludibacter sp.]|uniref:Uncharacterized protein n=1 Tax=uncultured Paludibacter sp. TaxID=497635 RepID=A0A653ABN1_9BACT|nr:hypothetical protein TRIP_D300068 [uncultured Paludibacter sp.]